MARIGLAKPYYAKYAALNGVVTYSDGGLIGRAVEAQMELEDTEAIVLYADNVAAESVASFSTGTLTLTVDELSVATAGAILGITPVAVTSPGTGTTLEFKSGQAIPYLGLGLIVNKVVNNVNVYMGLILNKIQFRIPAGDYSTMGETIEFQTPELEATIMKDDTSDGVWQEWGEFATFANAEAWVKAKLSIT